MRIALLVGSPQIGGTERQVAYLADGLEQAGHEVTVLFMSPAPRSGTPTVHFRNRRQLFLGYSGRHRLRPLLRLWRELYWTCPDVLHMFNLEAMRLGSPVARCAGVPVQIGSIRGLRFAHEPRCERRTSAAIRGMARVTVNSKAIAEELLRRAMCSPRKVVWIPNGIRTDLPDRVPGNGVARILFAGSLKPVKDPACFVEACLQVLASGVPCRVRIAGAGPLLPELQQMVARRRQAEHFEFLGNVPPDRVPYAESDLVVNTSRREGTSNTLLEAMAHGVAVIGTDAGGTATLMRQGEFGIPVPPADAGAVAAAIRQLVENAALRERLGANGACFVRNNFTIGAMVRRHVEMYRDLRVIAR